MVTVSPGYAWEIQTPEGGWGMEHMLRSRAYGLNGVLNGIDLREWNPESDDLIYEQYGPDNFSQGKAANKAGLQRELGLPERPEVCPTALPPPPRPPLSPTHTRIHTSPNNPPPLLTLAVTYSVAEGIFQGVWPFCITQNKGRVWYHLLWCNALLI